MPDLVADILDLVDTNWPGTFGNGKPTLYNAFDGHVRGEDFDRKPDLTRANVVSASRGPVGRTPLGTDFNYKAEPVVGVRVEAVRDDMTMTSGVGVDPDGANDDDFDQLVDDVQAAINQDRTYPSAPGADYDWLHILIENEQAPKRPVGYYEVTFDCRYKGYETP